MNREDARMEIISRTPDFLPKARHGGYVCPACRNGSGTAGTGITLSPDKKHYKCFACGLYEDVIGLWKQYAGITDDRVAFDQLYDYFGLIIDDTAIETMKEMESMTTDDMSQNTKAHDIQDARVQEDFTNFFIRANKDLSKTDYYRGVSISTLNRFCVGYVDQWRVNDRAPFSPRLIIPTSKYSYLARDTRSSLTATEARYAKIKQGPLHIFNNISLKTAQKPIFVVEGELDALSIIDTGGEAVGLGSINMVDTFLKLLEETRPQQPLIISLDNELTPQVRHAVEKLRGGLQRLQIQFFEFNPCGDYKDANEALQADRTGFTKAIEQTYAMIKSGELLTTTEKETADYLRISAGAHIQEFMDGIAESVNSPCIPTGFDILDRDLEGGLYRGLYIIGALSSLGKTTLMLQMMDQIAKSGQDVLIFSLEMSRAELMAKSISRETVDICIRNGIDTRNAKTEIGITSGSRYQYYSTTEIQLIKDAVTQYSEYAAHIYIIEGIGNVGVQEIRRCIDQHIRLTGNKPVVLVDYIQIIAPADIKGTDKQNMDKAVLELRRISRDFNTPILGISSLNRASYDKEVDMISFKESGAIEYSSDVLLGLYFKDVEKQGFDVDEAKAKNPRDIIMKIIKNRKGRIGGKIHFEYMPMFNRFEEIGRMDKNGS